MGNGVLWRGPEGNVLLPGSKKYDMQIISEFNNTSGADSECKKAELIINNCEWGKDSGEYSLSLISTTSEDMTFLFTITLFVRCKNKYFHYFVHIPYALFRLSVFTFQKTEQIDIHQIQQPHRVISALETGEPLINSSLELRLCKC